MLREFLTTTTNPDLCIRSHHSPLGVAFDAFCSPPQQEAACVGMNWRFGCRLCPGTEHWTAWREDGQISHSPAVRCGSAYVCTMCSVCVCFYKDLTEIQQYLKYCKGLVLLLMLGTSRCHCIKLFVLAVFSLPNLWSTLGRKKGGCSLTSSSASSTHSYSRSARHVRIWTTCSDARTKKRGGHEWRPW